MVTRRFLNELCIALGVAGILLEWNTIIYFAVELVDIEVLFTTVLIIVIASTTFIARYKPQ